MFARKLPQSGLKQNHFTLKYWLETLKNTLFSAGTQKYMFFHRFIDTIFVICSGFYKKYFYKIHNAATFFEREEEQRGLLNLLEKSFFLIIRLGNSISKILFYAQIVRKVQKNHAILSLFKKKKNKGLCRFIENT